MKNRLLIFIPEINPNTFLLFYFKGQTGRSYSLREYPQQGGVIVKRADAFPYSAEKIISMAKFSFDAPTHRTTDEAFWRKEISKLNQQYLKDEHVPDQFDHSPTEQHKKNSYPKYSKQKG